MFFCCCTEAGGEEIKSEDAAGGTAPFPATTVWQDKVTHQSAYGDNEKLEEVAPRQEAAKVDDSPPRTLPAQMNTEHSSTTRVPFEVLLVKKPGMPKVGLDVTHFGGNALKIKRIKDGLVNQWNVDHSSEPNMQLREGDLITKVNQVETEPKALLEMMGQQDRLELWVVPPEAR